MHKQVNALDFAAGWDAPIYAPFSGTVTYTKSTSTSPRCGNKIVLEGEDAARAVVHAGMVGQRTGAALIHGIDADLYRFELELVNDGGDWQIIGADYRRALGE